MTKRRKHTAIARRPRVKRGAVTRRAVGKLGGFDFMDPVLVAGGAIGGKFLNTLFPDLDPKIKAGAKIVIGALAPTFIKNPKTKMMAHHLGDGLVACGAIELAQELGIIAGVGEIKDDDFLIVSLDGVDGIEDIEFENISDDVNEIISDDILNGNDVNVVSDDVNVVSDDILNG